MSRPWSGMTICVDGAVGPEDDEVGAAEDVVGASLDEEDEGADDEVEEEDDAEDDEDDVFGCDADGLDDDGRVCDGELLLLVLREPRVEDEAVAEDDRVES